MQILSHLSDRGSNFTAPKKESFNLSMSIGINFEPIVLSWISAYGNFSVIKALLTTCLRSLLFIKKVPIFKLFFSFEILSYNLQISLAIASGCSKSEPSSWNLLASLGSSLFFEINQKFWLFSFFLKSILRISEYLNSKTFLKSKIVFYIGIVKNFSSSALIVLISGFVIFSYGSIITETINSKHSSPRLFFAQIYKLL